MAHIYETREIADEIGAFRKRTGDIKDYKIGVSGNGWLVMPTDPPNKRKPKKPAYVITLRKKKVA